MTAMPMLAVTTTSARSSANGSLRAWMARSASSSTWCIVREVLADDDELVSSEPGDGVVAADRRGETTTHRHEQLVARVVAEAVVDHLEAVEVEEEHRHHRFVVVQALQRGVETVDGERAVRQLGERVVECEMAELSGVRRTVERDAHDVPDAIHHRSLGVGRLTRGSHVDREHSQQPLVVGVRIGTDQNARKPSLRVNSRSC